MPDPKIEDGVLYGWNPVTMQYYAVDGDGTEINPYRPDSWELFYFLMSQTHASMSGEYHIKFADEICSWEQESVKTGDTTEDIARKKKTIDMNKVIPEGANLVANKAAFYFKQIFVNGNNTTIKNYYATNTNKPFMHLDPKCLVQNLNITNAYYNNGQTSNTNCIFRSTSTIANYTSILKNCKISVVVNKHEQDLFGGQTTNGQTKYLNNSFNIRVVTPLAATGYSFVVCDSKTSFTNNSFKIKVDCMKYGYQIFRAFDNNNYSAYLFENNKYDIYFYNDNVKTFTVYMIGQTGGAGGTTTDVTFSNNVFIIKSKTKYNNLTDGYTYLKPYNDTVYAVVGNWSNTNLINNNFTRDGTWKANCKFPTDAQLVDKDYLIQVGFPIMYEDEG